MTMYREPEIEKPPGISAAVLDARQMQALKVFLATPNIARGPVPPPAILTQPSMGQFSGAGSGTGKKKRPTHNEFGIPIGKGTSGGRGSSVFRQTETFQGPADVAASNWYDAMPIETEDNYGNFAAFAEGGDVVTGDEGLTDEEKRLREATAIANAGDVPVAAPAKTFLGTPVTAPPVYGPPVPSPLENQAAYIQQAQQVFQQNPELVSVAAGEAQANNADANLAQLRTLYANQQARDESQQRMAQAAQQLGGGTGVGGVVRDAISNVATETVLPALQRTIIGGSPAGGQLAGLPGATTYEQGTKAELPYAVAAREQAGAIGEKVGEPVGLGGVTRFIAQAPFVTNVGDLALVAGTAGMAKTPFEGITGVPWVNPVEGVRGSIARQADNVLPSMGRFAPDAVPGGRSIASQVNMPSISGAASQQEPLTSILRRADAGDPKITAAYLRSVADDRGIDLAGATKKSEVLAALRGAEMPAGGGTPGSLPGPEAVAGPVAATPPPASALATPPAAPTRELWDDFVAENVPNPGALPVNDLDKYNVSQVYALSDPPNPPVQGMEGNEIRTRLYNAGLDSNGKAAELRARYTEATERGIKLPYDEVPSEMPDMRDLALAGRTPQAPLNAPPEEIARQGRLAGASGRVDSLIAEARQAERAAQQVPAPSDVRALTADDAIAESRRLGNVMDEQAFNKGTALTRDIELEKLQRAADAENERLLEQALGAEGRATSAIRTQNAELGLVQGPSGAADDLLTPAQREFLGSQNGLDAAAQRGGGRGWADPAQRPAGSGGAAVASRYGQTNLAGAAKSVNLYGRLMDALYIPLSGDIGTALRQDVAQTLNVFNINQTREVAAYTARAAASREGAQKVMDDLLGKLDTIKSKFGDIDLQLADVQGVKSGEGLLNRETMTSAGLGKVPGLGLPFNVTARANAMELNARRVLELERFTLNHPNATKAQVQTAANMYERFTGRGTLGKVGDEALANKIGPLFTSLRFALAIPERVPYLLPWTRLADGSMEIGGPVWREAVKEHAGFFATAGGLMALAGEAGAEVDWDRGKITVGNTDVDLWGGASQYFTMVRNGVEGEKNGVPYPSLLERGSDGQYRGTVAEFVRNKIGPLPGAILQGAKLGDIDKKLGITSEVQFLQPDYWDKGMFGIAGTTGEIIDKAASFLVPIWVGDVIEAAKVANQTGVGNPINTALMTGALAFFGAGVQNYGGRAERERSQQRNEITIKDHDATFGPDLAKVIPPESRYAELGSREKELVNAKLGPAELKALQDRAIKEGNEGERATREKAELKASYRPSFDKLDTALRDGTMTPYQVRQAATALERHMYDAVDKIKYPERETSGSYKPSPIQQAETGYRALYDKVPKGADGKTDYDTLRSLQQSYLAAVSKTSGPEFAGRLAFNVLPRVGPNDSPIQQFYDQPQMKAAVSAYNADGVNKTGYLLENPSNNALLYAGGYVRTLNTPDAVAAYKGYSKGEPEINFTVGFRQEGFVSYANLGGGPLGDQVRTYQALPSGEGEYERPDYLRAHPELNVLLWQTGHTSKAYSLKAYGAMNKVASR